MHGLVLVARDGLLVTLAKVGRRAKVAGHQKVKNAPEIEHRVLHRRAREHEPVASADGLHGERILGLTVLDVLGLVEHERVELHLAIPLRVASNQRITSDDEVTLGDVLEVLVPAGAVQRDDLQPGCELLRLRQPVENQGSRADDKHRAG